MTADVMREVYETNVFGIVRVTHAMLPLLRACANSVIVNVASGLGSFEVVHDPGRSSHASPRSRTARRSPSRC